MKMVHGYNRRMIGMILCILLLFLTAVPVSTNAETVNLSKPMLAASCLSKTAVSLEVKKVNNATGYIFYRSKQKSKGYTKIKTSNLTTYEDRGLSEGNYYYKVRAYRNSNGKKIYSSYSNEVYVKVSAIARINSVITDTNGFDFTAYDSITEKDTYINLIGNLVYTYDGKSTRFYGPDSSLIAEFSGNIEYIFYVMTNTYVKEDEGEYKYKDIWLDEVGKLDVSEDWCSDFIWVEDTLINIKTGKVMKQYKFDEIYGTNSGIASQPNLVDGCATIRVDDKYGMMDEKGNIIVEPLYEYGEIISGGYVIFENAEKKWAYCDASGTMSDFKFSALRDGGQSGILIGEIDKEYFYSTQEGNLLDLSEKVIINHGKEYSICANLPNCSVDLGTFSDGYAHALIKYYYVDLKLGLNSYTAFDGYVDTKGAKKIDFTEHKKEDLTLLTSIASSFGVDFDLMGITSALKPLSLDVSTQPTIENSSYFKYGLLVVNTKLLTVSMSDELSQDYFTAFGIYDKLGVQILSFDKEEYNRDVEDKDGIKKAEILGANCIATLTKGNVLSLKDVSGKNKQSIPNVTNFETIQSTSGYPIIRIETTVKDGNTEKDYYGIYYDQTGFYTGQYYAFPNKTYYGNDDMIFTMKDGSEIKFVTSKNKIIIPATECFDIKPTGDGYAVIKNKDLSSSGYYYVTFYTGAGKKIKTVYSLGFDVSALAYGTGGMMYTDHTVVLNSHYHNGLGKLLNTEEFYTENTVFNHGYAFVRKLNQDNYALMSSDGTLLSDYCFTKETEIFHSKDTPNKYGSILINLDGNVYRVHKD